MKKVLFGMVLVFAVFILGCQPGRTSGRMKQELEVMESLHPQLEMYLRMLEQYRNIGIAEIRINPSNGKLFIDGGEYVGDDKEIQLPIGTYEFKAVWKDGRETTRRIFVEGALGEGTINLNWEKTGGSLNWKIGDDELEINKTRVELWR